jgi:hypothetical protein
LQHHARCDLVSAAYQIAASSYSSAGYLDVASTRDG